MIRRLVAGQESGRTGEAPFEGSRDRKRRGQSG